MFINSSASVTDPSPHVGNFNEPPTPETARPDYEVAETREEEGHYGYYEDDSSIGDDFEYTMFNDESDGLERSPSPVPDVPQGTSQNNYAPSRHGEPVDHATPIHHHYEREFNTATYRATPEPNWSEYEDSDLESAVSDGQNGTRESTNHIHGYRIHEQSNESRYDSDSDTSEYYSSGSEWEWTIPSLIHPLELRVDAFIDYEQRWISIFSLEDLDFHSIPWPQYPPPTTVLDVNVNRIREFLRIPALTGTSGCSLKTTVRQALLRFHPDKTALLLARVGKDQQKAVMEGCAAVARCLNDIKETL